MLKTLWYLFKYRKQLFGDHTKALAFRTCSKNWAFAVYHPKYNSFQVWPPAGKAWVIHLGTFLGGSDYQVMDTNKALELANYKKRVKHDRSKMPSASSLSR